MNGADLLARMLRAYGVRHIFGVPGDTNISFYAALEELGGEVQHILTRDERNAGYMADAYARITNRPGVVEVPSGGGSMYALPAIAEAHESSVPVILLSFDMPMVGEGRSVITQFVDLVRLYEPLTKASIQVKMAAKIPEIVRRAFRVATTGRPGAVHLVIPEDILHQEVDPDEVSMHIEEQCTSFPAHAPAATQVQVLELQQLIVAAQRPLLVVGGGVNRAMGSNALTELAEQLRVPVVTTITGQNAIPDHHELAIGIVGDNGFHPHANRAMEEADLLIYIGCRIGSVVTIGGTFPAPRPQRRIAQIDICPEVLGNTSSNALSIHGDARIVMQQLRELPRPASMRTDAKWVETLNAWRRRFWLESVPKSDGPGPLRPQVIIESLNRRLQEPHFLLADPGTSTAYLNRYLRFDDAASRILIPRAYGALGYALPAVVGAWAACPQSRPIALFGDGSFMMSLGDLETIARLQVPAILLNFNNSCFGWIKALQKSRGTPGPLSVDFSAQDASAIARGFGLDARRVETRAELEDAMDAAFARRAPILLDIVVESVADVVPPVYNWLHKTGIDPLAVGGRRLELA